jgi:hypothetical protein
MENDSGTEKRFPWADPHAAVRIRPSHMWGGLNRRCDPGIKRKTEKVNPPIPQCAHRGLPTAGEARGERALTETGKDITIPEEYQRENAGRPV